MGDETDDVQKVQGKPSRSHVITAINTSNVLPPQSPSSLDRMEESDGETKLHGEAGAPKSDAL